MNLTKQKKKYQRKLNTAGVQLTSAVCRPLGVFNCKY